MKKVISFSYLVLMLLSVTFKANAQAVDMQLLNPNLTPRPGEYPGTVDFGFDIMAESLDEILSSNDVSNSFAQITITLSELDGTGIVPSGAGADLFNWTYVAESKSFKGTSKEGVVLLADTPYPIIFTGVKTTGVTTGNTAGFQANLTPPGDLYVSETNDDVVAFFTNVVLPVTLVSFDAAKENTIVQLNWASTEEVNSDHFEIQRSMNGKDWAAIGDVAAAGDIRALQKYAFTDKAPVGGENLYRLKMIDRDQTFAYSRIKSVKFDELMDADLSVYPNPVTDQLNIRDISGVAQINIYDLKGLSLYQSVNPKTAEINVKDLRGGMYIVKIQRANGLSSSQKIVVNK